MMAPYQLPLRLVLKNVAVRLPRNTGVFQSFHNTGIIIHYYHFKRQTRWAAPVLTRRKRGWVASLTPDLFCRPENSGTNQIPAFKWPLSETRS